MSKKNIVVLIVQTVCTIRKYIFVNVSFDWGAKTYCYLCDDELIQEGDEVLVPVGKDGDLKTVYVESVELHTAEDAPFPIDKCKKVVRRL